jgi:hypothetical protein
MLESPQKNWSYIFSPTRNIRPSHPWCDQRTEHELRLLRVGYVGVVLQKRLAIVFKKELLFLNNLLLTLYLGNGNIHF